MNKSTRTSRGQRKPLLGYEEPGIHVIHDATLGPLVMARDLLMLLGYRLPPASVAVLLRRLGVPKSECRNVGADDVANPVEARLPLQGATFLTRKGVNLILMTSTLPKAQAFREWLAGEVVPAVLDTGNYPAKIN